MQMATDEDSTATILISAKGDAQGVTASDYAQESYQQAYLGPYSDVSFEKFDNNAELDGKSTLFAQFKGTTALTILIVTATVFYLPVYFRVSQLSSKSHHLYLTSCYAILKTSYLQIS